jgi:hypothetical protein
MLLVPLRGQVYRELANDMGATSTGSGVGRMQEWDRTGPSLSTSTWQKGNENTQDWDLRWVGDAAPVRAERWSDDPGDVFSYDTMSDLEVQQPDAKPEQEDEDDDEEERRRLRVLQEFSGENLRVLSEAKSQADAAAEKAESIAQRNMQLLDRLYSAASVFQKREQDVRELQTLVRNLAESKNKDVDNGFSQKLEELETAFNNLKATREQQNRNTDNKSTDNKSTDNENTATENTANGNMDNKNTANGNMDNKNTDNKTATASVSEDSNKNSDDDDDIDALIDKAQDAVKKSSEVLQQGMKLIGKK